MKDKKIALITAPFYQHIVDGLFKGATKYLEQHLLEYERFNVPGALEIPLMCEHLAHLQTSTLNRRYPAIIVLGAVIRGETAHFDHVCQQSARGIMDVSLRHVLPIGNGIITVENETQAIARSSDDDKNKGYEAAHAAIEMLRLTQQ